MAETENNVLTLVDEDGAEHSFALVDIVELDEAKYAVMVPTDEAECGDDCECGCGCEEQEAVLFRIETEADGSEVLVDIDDDAEFERVCAYIDELMAEEDENDQEDKDN